MFCSAMMSCFNSHNKSKKRTQARNKKNGGGKIFKDRKRKLDASGLGLWKRKLDASGLGLWKRKLDASALGLWKIGKDNLSNHG